MTTAFLIRLHYPPGPQADWRLAYFETQCLPRILQQSGEFDVCVWCEPHHWSRVAAMGCKPFRMRPEFDGWVKPGYEHKTDRYHVDFHPWSHVAYLPRYDLQIAIDSDELLLREDTLDRLRTELLSVPDGETAHISFQHEMFDVDRLELCRSQFRYSEDKGSPFYALWQPGVAESEYVFCYDDSHQQIGQQMKHRRFVSDDGDRAYVAASVHGFNASTKRRPGSGVIVRSV